MPTPRPKRPFPHGYSSSDRELTSEEVRAEFGEVIDAFLVGLHQDPVLLGEVIASAVKIARRHDNEQARAARYREAKAEREGAASGHIQVT